MRLDILIRGGTLLTETGPVRCDIGIRREKIAAAARGLKAPEAKVVDASGCFVLPGGVDAHTHLDMPFAGTTTADDFATGSLAAVCGGTTTIIDFATQDKGRPMMAALEAWRRKADGRCVADYGFHMAVVDLGGGRLKEMDRIAREGCPSFKFYMAYPGRLMLDDGAIFRAMLRCRENGSVVCVHAENGGIIDALIEKALAQGRTHPRWHALTRPAQAEAEAAHRAIALAELSGAALYVVHVSTSEAAAEIRRARERGLRVFGETCPQYLYLSDNAYESPGFEGAKFVIAPPLRPAGHQRALWSAVREDWLQVVSTDHCSFNFKAGRGASKQMGRGDFSRIPGGSPGIETRVALMWDAVERGDLSPARFVQLVCANPAKMFGLYPRKGCLAPGSDADIVVLVPSVKRVLSAKTHHMNVDYSPYEGRVVRGAVRDVLIRGRFALTGFKPVGNPPRGVFLERRGPCEW